MPPKKGKKDTPVQKKLLGRPGNNVRMGVVGLPNVGKSTFFNVLSKLNVPAENYPFCTIEPHESRVPVPDRRFDQLVAHYNPKSVVPAVLGITDIAGLVKGASEGAGLGNEFLSNISAVDGIFHVCREFPKKAVTHVEGSIDPCRDLQIIHDELRLKDIQAVKAFTEKEKKFVDKGVGGKERKVVYEAACSVLAVLEDGKDVRSADWGTVAVEWLNTMQLLSAKPMIYLLNVSKKMYENGSSKYVKTVKDWVKARGNAEKVIVFSADWETMWFELSDDEKTDYAADNKARSMLDRIILSGYKGLHLSHFFTSGPDEVRAWTIKNGSFAPQAAGVIHTDFEKTFICAEVHKFADFEELGSEKACKDAGKLRTQGRTYVVEDGDICFFKFGAK